MYNVLNIHMDLEWDNPGLSYLSLNPTATPVSPSNSSSRDPSEQATTRRGLNVKAVAATSPLPAAATKRATCRAIALQARAARHASLHVRQDSTRRTRSSLSSRLSSMAGWGWGWASGCICRQAQGRGSLLTAYATPATCGVQEW